MATVHSLSDSDVAAVREELSSGKPPTVWFTALAVGVPVGGSAKVTSVGAVPEGEFIEVRPAGSRDTMFCSANELTRTRPPRRRAPRAAAAGEPASPAAADAQAADERPAGGPVEPARRSRPRSTPKPAPVVAEPAPVARADRPGPETDGPAAVGARRSGHRRPPSAEVTVTLAASTEGEWTVEVVVGRKRTVRAMPVQPVEVAKAARSLPAPVAEAIDASLVAARTRQAERVEQLRAELEAAEGALRELSG